MMPKVVLHPAESPHHGGAHLHPDGADDFVVDSGGWSADLSADWNVGNGASELVGPFIQSPEAASGVYNGGSVVGGGAAAGSLPPAGASGSTSGSGGSAPGVAANTVSGGLVVNLIWDSAALAAPQSFRDAVQAGADALE